MHQDISYSRIHHSSKYTFLIIDIDKLDTGLAHQGISSILLKFHLNCQFGIAELSSFGPSCNSQQKRRFYSYLS